MVSTRPLISKSSCTIPLVTVPSAPITIGITVTFMFYFFFFFQFSSTVQSLISLFTFLQFYLYYNYLFFISLEFFTSALAHGLSLEFEWQQISSSLQDSSQYSGRLLLLLLFIWTCIFFNFNFIHSFTDSCSAVNKLLSVWIAKKNKKINRLSKNIWQH